MKPRLVLVLDEDTERRESLVALLRGANHEVLAVSDPDAAAEAIGSGSFDTLVLSLTLAHVSSAVLRSAIAFAEADVPQSLEEAERAHLARVLQYTAGNKRKAAHLLGISRSTLLNKVRKYGLER